MQTESDTPGKSNATSQTELEASFIAKTQVKKPINFYLRSNTLKNSTAAAEPFSLKTIDLYEDVDFDNNVDFRSSKKISFSEKSNPVEFQATKVKETFRNAKLMYTNDNDQLNNILQETVGDEFISTSKKPVSCLQHKGILTYY